METADKLKIRLLKTIWSEKDYYLVASQSVHLGFAKNKYLKKLKLYARNARLILDCGCGGASIMEKIWHKKGKFYGYDISPLGIKIAQKRLLKKNVRFIIGDLEKINFPDNFFDLVYTAYSLEHLTDPQKALQEMVRVTKKNGRLILISPNFGSCLFPSPSSLYGEKNLLYRAVCLFLKSHLYVFSQPENLSWEMVKPLSLKAKKWQPDWDTATEPYLQTLIYFLQKKGIKIKMAETDLATDKNEKVDLSTRSKLLNTFKKLSLALGRLKIPPYKYYGSTFFLIGEKQ